MQRPPKYASVRKSRTVDHVLLVEDPHSVCCTVRTLNAQHGYCPVLVGSFIACVYTGWAKKSAHQLHGHNSAKSQPILAHPVYL